MKNINVKNILKPILYVFMGLVLILFILFGSIELGIWHSVGFNKTKREISSCNDRGGAWDEKTKSCLDEK